MRDTVNPGQGADAPASDIDSHKIRVTFFKDLFAATLETRELTLLELCAGIHKPVRKIKDKLPLLKLATFGDKLSPPDADGKGGGSLRWDENVTGIEGIELDYDCKGVTKPMSFEEAIEKLKEMKVRCLIYTTPSYTAVTPNWRLLIPLSKTELRVEMRKKYVTRVIGFFSKKFDPASFTLSQGFYYGRAKDNPDADHKAEVIDGQFIDLRDELDKYEAKGEQENDAAAKKTGTKKKEGGRGFEAYLKIMGDPTPPLGGFNGPLISASSSYALHHGAELIARN